MGKWWVNMATGGSPGRSSGGAMSESAAGGAAVVWEQMDSTGGNGMLLDAPLLAMHNLSRPECEHWKVSLGW
jgi:hypothetical protein